MCCNYPHLHILHPMYIWDQERTLLTRQDYIFTTWFHINVSKLIWHDLWCFQVNKCCYVLHRASKGFQHLSAFLFPSDQSCKFFTSIKIEINRLRLQPYVLPHTVKFAEGETKVICVCDNGGAMAVTGHKPKPTHTDTDKHHLHPSAWLCPVSPRSEAVREHRKHKGHWLEIDGGASRDVTLTEILHQHQKNCTILYNQSSFHLLPQYIRCLQ